MTQQIKKFHRLRVLIVSLLSVAIALLVIIGALSLRDGGFWRGLLSNIGQTILVGGVLSLAYEYFLREDVINIQHESEVRIISAYEGLAEKFDLAEGGSYLGLTRAHPKEHSVDYGPILLGSRDIVLLFNDGRTWVSSHQADLYERLQKRCSTTILVAHPNSPFLDALAVKVESDKLKLQTKIYETISMLTKMASDQHDLKIYGHFMPSSYSMVMNEEKCIFVPYPLSRKEDRIPAFEFRSEGEGAFYLLLKRDIDTLISDCSLMLFPSADDGVPKRLGHLQRQ